MKNIKRIINITLFSLVVTAWSMPVAAGLQAVYEYPLSNFSGLVPSLLARLSVDQERNEIYVINPQSRDIRIFNDYGMQIHNFGEDGPLSNAIDIAVGDDGDIFVLPRGYGENVVIRCNYRGEQLSEITLKDIPAEISYRIRPGRILYRDGHLYVADSTIMVVVVVDLNGVFQEAYDLKDTMAAAIKQDFAARRETIEDDGLQKAEIAQQQLQHLVEEEQKQLKELHEVNMSGFSIDADGNFLFTVPALFTVGRLSPDGELKMFGQSGSGPGKFGVISGVYSDRNGNVYVADKLRCVVMIFDRNFAFLTEFGQRGHQPQNLIVPSDLVLDGHGKVYVSQAANRGVNVYSIIEN